MASRAMSKAAGAVDASMPVTNCQILLRPVIKGLPLDLESFARHLTAFKRDKVSAPPPEDIAVSGYDTGVSEGFRQAGNNVALSRALLSVGTLINAPFLVEL